MPAGIAIQPASFRDRTGDRAVSRGRVAVSRRPSTFLDAPRGARPRNPPVRHGLAAPPIGTRLAPGVVMARGTALSGTEDPLTPMISIPVRAASFLRSIGFALRLLAVGCLYLLLKLFFRLRR